MHWALLIVSWLSTLSFYFLVSASISRDPSSNFMTSSASILSLCLPSTCGVSHFLLSFASSKLLSVSSFSLSHSRGSLFSPSVSSSTSAWPTAPFLSTWRDLACPRDLWAFSCKPPPASISAERCRPYESAQPSLIQAEASLAGTQLSSCDTHSSLPRVDYLTEPCGTTLWLEEGSPYPWGCPQDFRWVALNASDLPSKSDLLTLPPHCFQWLLIVRVHP